MPTGVSITSGVSSSGWSAPIASGNFTNIATNNAADGVYTLNGVPCVIGDIIDLDHAETTFNAVTDIDAGGIKCPDGGGGSFITRQLAMNTPLLTSLLADGFTLLLEFYVEEKVGASLSVHDDAFNFEAAAISQYTVGFKNTKVQDKDYNEVTDSVHYPALLQENKLAITVAADRVSASVNGAVIVTRAGSGLDASMQSVVISFSAGADERLRSFAFYEVVDDADLPALSAL